jgi:hypothetical protein
VLLKKPGLMGGTLKPQLGGGFSINQLKYYYLLLDMKIRNKQSKSFITTNANTPKPGLEGATP